MAPKNVQRYAAQMSVNYLKLLKCSAAKSQQGRKHWLGRQDSNLRMPASKAGALPLGDAPTA
jgi:hypothetical protein